MAVTISVYNKFRATITGGETAQSANSPVDYLSDGVNLALVTNTYTPSLTADDYWNDVVANELATASGYTANGVATGSKTVAESSGTATYDAADPSWTFTANVAFRYGVFYDRTPATDATRPLMFLVDFVGSGSNLSVPASVFTVTLNASGLFTIT